MCSVSIFRPEESHDRPSAATPFTRPDTGASAVEFALLAPVLFLILFGIIDYGIWFADSISMRQAVRDAARQGSVENFGTACSATRHGARTCTSSRAAWRPRQAPISGTSPSGP